MGALLVKTTVEVSESEKMIMALLANTLYFDMLKFLSPIQAPAMIPVFAK